MRRAWLALLAVLGVALSAAAETEVRTGDTFPSLVGVECDRGSPPATEGRVVLVDFWASWCAPCKASFPAYAKLQADYAARGLLIVAVSVDEDADAYGAFVKRFNPTFLTVRDKSKQLVSQVKVPAMPTCYLVGCDGKVRFRHEGFHGADTERELRQEIDSLLNEKSNSP